MDDLESEVSEMTIKNTVTKIAQTPSNLFKNVVKIIPNPFYLILNPMTFPIIILSPSFNLCWTTLFSST